MNSPRPVIYLDVDGCILRFPNDREFYKENPGGGPANGVREFLEWATTHCDVRWLTCWGGCGDIGDQGRDMLARRLRVPVGLLTPIRNPMMWDHDKPEGINWQEHAAGLPWVWLDDEAIARELDTLREHGAIEHFIQCDTSRDPDALLKAWTMIRERFGLPESPTPHQDTP